MHKIRILEDGTLKNYDRFQFQIIIIEYFETQNKIKMWFYNFDFKILVDNYLTLKVVVIINKLNITLATFFYIYT